MSAPAEKPHKPYSGPMADVPGLTIDPVFAHIPKTVEISRSRLDKWGGWPGLIVPYMDALRPLELTSSDVFLDVGCGLGEHSIIAALGYPGRLASVKTSVGVSASKKEIELATRLARYAQKNPDGFQSLIDWEPSERGGKMIILNQAIPELDEGKLGVVPANLDLRRANVYHLPFPDSGFTKVLSSSVAPYITLDPDVGVSMDAKRQSMFKELIRVTASDGLVHVFSTYYQKDDSTFTSAKDEFLAVAEALGVDFTVPYNTKNGYPDAHNPTEFKECRHIVLKIRDKPQEIPGGLFQLK